jgi:hypothetical protein
MNLVLPNKLKMHTTPADIRFARLESMMYGDYNRRGRFMYPESPTGFAGLGALLPDVASQGSLGPGCDPALQGAGWLPGSWGVEKAYLDSLDLSSQPANLPRIVRQLNASGWSDSQKRCFLDLMAPWNPDFEAYMKWAQGDTGPAPLSPPSAILNALAPSGGAVAVPPGGPVGGVMSVNGQWVDASGNPVSVPGFQTATPAASSGVAAASQPSTSVLSSIPWYVWALGAAGAYFAFRRAS